MMSNNGNTARWIGLISGIILVLGFGTAGMVQGTTATRVQRNEDDIREVEINQAVVIEELRHINEKLDRLLK